jgi:hypothetical protein
MERSVVPKRFITRLFAIAAALLALAAPATIIYAHRVASFEGNVDSGALLPIFALGYLLPAAGLCVAAAVARTRQWEDRRAVQWLAIVWLGGPLALLLVSPMFG